MRITLAAGIFSLAVFAAACGGGGKSGILPTAVTQPSSPAAPTPGITGKRQMTVALNIPPASQQSNKRKPYFISPNTQSIVIAVVPNGTTPAPASAQVFPVTTPSPCATNPVTGGESCTFNVTVPFGNDQFYVGTFAVASPNPSSSPLAQFVSGAIVISSPSPGPTPTPLAFTLNGIVQRVVVTVPNPDPSNTPNTQVFTVEVPTSAPLGITPYDASGAPIMSDGFTAPIPLSVLPGGSGVTLAIAATCPGSGGSGAAVTVGCAANLGNVTFAYDGSVTADANDHILDTFTISATQNASPAPSPATVVLQSNVQTYTPNPGAYTFAYAQLQALPNNVIGLMLSGSASVVGAYETLTVGTGTFSAPVILNATNPNGFYAMTDGSIWVSDSSNTQLECYNAGGGTAVATYPLTGTLSAVDNVTFDGTNLWWTGYNAGSVDYAYYAPVPSSCALGAATGIILPSDPYGDAHLHMAPLVGGGVAIDGENDGGFWTATTAGATYFSPGFGAGSGFGGGVAVDGAGTIFAAFNNNCGASCAESNIMKLTGGALALVDTVPSIQFGAMAAFGPTPGGAADRLAFADTTDAALGLVANPNATPAALLVAMPSASFSDTGQNVAISTKGGSFISYKNTTTSALTVGRSLLTTTWSIPVTNFPSGNILSIDERVDSSPFTITPVGTPPACYTGTALLTYSTHDFRIGTLSNGPNCTVTLMVSDKNGRSQTVTVTVPEPIT